MGQEQDFAEASGVMGQAGRGRIFLISILVKAPLFLYIYGFDIILYLQK